MTFWKTAIVGATLAAAACQPVGQPMGEQRLATKIAEEVMTEQMLSQTVRQQVQTLMGQGAIGSDQVNQAAIAISRDLEAKLPEVRKTLVTSLMREYNVKELDFLHKLLVSKESKAVNEKQQAAMQDSMMQLDTFAQESASKVAARISSVWPTGAAPEQPAMPQMPPGMVMPNN